MTPDDFFDGRPESRRLFEAVRRAAEAAGPCAISATTSQIAFRRRTGFAAVWIPGMYLKKSDVPLVLSIGLRRRIESDRWKQVVEPAPGRFMHHLELRDESDVDDEVRGWLRESWEDAA